MPEAASPPATLWTRDDGSGPPVLLLHGLGGDHSVWNGVVPGLAEHFRVLAPDLRGHGRSALPDGSTLSFAELEGDLAQLLDRLGASPAHVVGLSAGGFLALQMAVDHPERLRSLTVVAGASHCDAHTRAIGERWSETYREQGYDAYVLRLLKDLFYPDWIEAHLDYADQLRSERRPRDPRAMIQWALAIRSFDLRGRLGRVRLPTLILQGVDDQVVDGSHGRLLRQTILGAQLRLFPQTGHLVPVERPSETAQAIGEFLVRVEAERPAPSA